MEAFVLAFIQRVSSGIQNGFGYSKKMIGLYGMGIVLILLPFLSFQNHWVSYLFIFVNLIIVFLKTISFTKKFPTLSKYKDIHLWENFVTGGYFLYLILVGYNILPIICSVYPALILHKGFINLGSKLSFFSEQTDDKTGKTYSIPLLGIKIKRSSTAYRLVLAGISLLALVIVLAFKISVTFFGI